MYPTPCGCFFKTSGNSLPCIFSTAHTTVTDTQTTQSHFFSSAGHQSPALSRLSEPRISIYFRISKNEVLPLDTPTGELCVPKTRVKSHSDAPHLILQKQESTMINSARTTPIKKIEDYQPSIEINPVFENKEDLLLTKTVEFGKLNKISDFKMRPKIRKDRKVALTRSRAIFEKNVAIIGDVKRWWNGIALKRKYSKKQLDILRGVLDQHLPEHAVSDQILLQSIKALRPVRSEEKVRAIIFQMVFNSILKT